jgi:hypothetical protein
MAVGVCSDVRRRGVYDADCDSRRAIGNERLAPAVDPVDHLGSGVLSGHVGFRIDPTDTGNVLMLLAPDHVPGGDVDHRPEFFLYLDFLRLDAPRRLYA